MEDIEKNENEETTQEEVISEGSGLNNLLKLLSFGVIAILGYLVITTSLKTCGKHDISYGNGQKYGEDEFDDAPASIDTTAATAIDTSNNSKTATAPIKDTVAVLSTKPTLANTIEKTTPSISQEDIHPPKQIAKPVEKPAVKPVTNETVAKTSEGANNNSILVIAGNYIQESNAKELQKKLMKAGIKNIEIITFDFSEFYTVIVGRYNDLAQAKKMVSTLKSKGFESYTHQKRKK